MAKNNDLLILVDAQLDFFSFGTDYKGSLDASVNTKSPQVILENITNLITYFHGRKIIYSQDWHPVDHISFDNITSNEGEMGPYPVHCVQGSRGAEIHPDIQQALELWQQKSPNSRDLQCIKKACGSAPFTNSNRLKENKDHNSVLGNTANIVNQDISQGNSVDPDVYKGQMLAEAISEHFIVNPDSKVYVAGFVTNICVLATVLDLLGVDKSDADKIKQDSEFKDEPLILTNATCHHRCKVDLDSKQIVVVHNCMLATGYRAAAGTLELFDKLGINFAEINTSNNIDTINGIPKIH